MLARTLRPVIILASLLGCTPQPHGPTIRPGDPEPKVEPGLSEEECRALGEKIAKAVRDGNPKALATVFDLDELIRKGIGDLDASNAAKDRFVAEIRGDARKGGVLEQRIRDQVSGGAEYKYLHAHVVGNEQRLLFRIARPTLDELVLNYHDVVLQRRPDGQVKATDVYVLANGELLSMTARRAFVLTRLRQLQPPADSLPPVERAYLLHLPLVERMMQLEREGNHAKALGIYDQLPTELQRDKNLLLIRLRAAQAVGEAAYAEAIQDFRTFHPDDPSIDLYGIEYFVHVKDFGRALASIDRVEKAVGDHAYMDLMRANVHQAAGNWAAARQAAEATVAAEPTLAAAHWILLNVSLHEKKHDETLNRLRELKRRFHPEFRDFATLPEYAEFVKSPQYQDWIKSQKSP